MSSIEGIPSYVLQNMAMIQENMKSVMADNVGIGSANSEFDSFLDSAIGDMKSTFSDSGFEESGVIYRNNAYDSMPGISGNSAKSNQADLMRELQTGNQQKQVIGGIASPESTETVKKAYDSLLNGDMAEQLAPQIASIQNQSMIEKLKNISKTGNNTSLITDEEFFDAESLTPGQITDILKRKGSPYAYQTFEGGKTIGQLIYDECHNAGSLEKGKNTLNPALVLSIMGAESSFGTDIKARKSNPFNIRMNGSFDSVKSVEQSLNIAVNTMYNWAVNRPANSKLSYLDYAGDKYCEDYSKEWKPNVEKYFTEFTIGSSSPALLDTKQDDAKTKLINQMMSSLSNSNSGANPMLKGMNMEALMQSTTDQNSPGQNILNNANMIPGLNTSSMLEEDSGE